MTVSEGAQLSAGDRLLLRRWDSIDPEIQSGLVIQVIKVFKRQRGPVLLARWDEDEVEVRLADYLDCLQPI